MDVRSFSAGLVFSIAFSVQACAPAASAPASRLAPERPVAAFASPPPACDYELQYAPNGERAARRSFAAPTTAIRPRIVSQDEKRIAE